MAKKVIWSYKKPKIEEKDTLYLDTKDINHLIRVHNKYNLQPESFDEVYVNFLADREYLIRFIIKELDILLKIGGRFIIKSTYSAAHANYIRSKSQIKNEFSLSTNGRYSLISQNIKNDILKLEYIKKEPTLGYSDSINKWSFGIITNGKKNEQVCRLVDSIIKQNIPNYEIIICGPFQNNSYKNIPITILDDVVLKDDIRAPITIKKNNIAKVAKYENLMIMHDRYLLPDDWFIKMKQYGNFFDLITMLNIGPNGGRVNDWGEHLGYPSQIYKELYNLLDYKNYSSYGWYAQGGLLIIKKSLFMQNLLDERLFWNELEDVTFSQIANLKGYFYYIDINNKIFTFSDRLSEIPVDYKQNIFTKIKQFISYYKTKIKLIYRHKKNLNE